MSALLDRTRLFERRVENNKKKNKIPCAVEILNYFKLFIQLFVPSIADPTADADKANANARTDGQEIDAICCPATHGVKNTVNARTVLAFVPKDGTEDTARYVSWKNQKLKT